MCPNTTQLELVLKLSETTDSYFTANMKYNFCSKVLFCCECGSSLSSLI